MNDEKNINKTEVKTLQTKQLDAQGTKKASMVVQSTESS